MTASLLESFVGEARELLQNAATALLVLEKQQHDQAAINDVFRSVHTLKGSVGLFDFPALLKLVHAGEDVLSAVRDGQLDLSSALVDLLLDALDQVGAWIDSIATGGALPAGADNVSRDMTAGLRGVLPTGPDMPANAEPAARTDELGNRGMAGHAGGTGPAGGLHGSGRRRHYPCAGVQSCRGLFFQRRRPAQSRCANWPGFTVSASNRSNPGQRSMRMMHFVATCASARWSPRRVPMSSPCSATSRSKCGLRRYRRMP